MKYSVQIRQKFKKWLEEVYFDGIDSLSEFDEERNCYKDFTDHVMFVAFVAGYECATEDSYYAYRVEKDYFNV